MSVANVLQIGGSDLPSSLTPGSSNMQLVAMLLESLNRFFELKLPKHF
jgi:hypothetical protein